MHFSSRTAKKLEINYHELNSIKLKTRYSTEDFTFKISRTTVKTIQICNFFSVFFQSTWYSTTRCDMET